MRPILHRAFFILNQQYHLYYSSNSLPLNVLTLLQHIFIKFFINYPATRTLIILAVQTLKADLSVGKYEVDVIAGAQMPRSKAEKAQIYMQLAQMGKIPDTKTGTELLLNALDIPDKTGILEAIEEQAQEIQNSQPPIAMDAELAAKLFKDIPLDCQLQYLAQWKTPDDILKSVQFYEKKYQPLEQSLKRMGFNEPSQLEQAFKDYNEKLPVYQENENTINILNALLQNEPYGSKLRNVFDEIRRAQETERFGMAFDDLPPIIKERVVKGEQAFQQLEEMKQEKAYNIALSTIQDQMAQIEQIAQETGLEFSQQKRKS